ncbi:MAG: PAS domain-containing protein [Ignavibacteria bacterium]|nr:PAS domain-containing protein [Ignavibacteria bacterium]
MSFDLKNLRKFSYIRPRYIIAISIVIAFVMIVYAFYELSKSKEEIYHVLDEYANSMIYTVNMSSANTVISDQEIENLLSQHLLGVARNILRLDSLMKISNTTLKHIADENEVYRINIFNEKGEKVLTSYEHDTSHIGLESKHSPKDFINPILSGEENELIIGLKEARHDRGNRFAVSVRRADNRRGAIVVNLDAESFLEFRKKIGFGRIVQDIGKSSGIVYIALQDSNGIIAADKPVDDLSLIMNDLFLENAYVSDSSLTRINTFEGNEVFEVVKPFIVEGEKLGLFRIGIAMDEIKSTESRMFNRAIIISIVLVVILVIAIGIIISNQNFKMVSEEYDKIQTFTGNILNDMVSAIITFDKDDIVRIFNKSAEVLFATPSNKFIGKNLTGALNRNFHFLSEAVNKKQQLINSEQVFDTEEGKKIFLINSTIIYDSSDNLDSYTLVIRDVTEIRTMEKQIIQREKLVAMGELASGVAHEIRNPLNTINMVAQRYEKEYADKLDSKEFISITKVLRSETERVNEIIQQFLRFARPPKLNISKVSSVEFINEIKDVMDVQANSNSIKLIVKTEGEIDLNIDFKQMKQAVINLLKNAIEASKPGDKVEFLYSTKIDKNIFEISDSGSGIPKENIDKIFNLYFTTKSNGTGLGLGIVQQIVSQHGGTITVESKIGKGSKFIIELPKN